MNDIERARLADNLTTAADGWTTADLEFIIGLLTTIRDMRHGSTIRAALTARAIEIRMGWPTGSIGTK